MKRRQFASGTAVIAAAFVETPALAQSGSVADRFAATLGAHDLVAFAALFDDGYVNHQSSAAAPPSRVKTPKQATVDYFTARLAGIPDLSVSIETQCASGDKIAASFVYSGHHGGELFGVAPTGKPLRFTSCDIYRVEDDRIVEHWGMGDIAGLLTQLRGAPAG